MEVSGVTYSRISLDQLQKEGSLGTQSQNFELEMEDLDNSHDNHHHFHSMNALEILRETVRILRSNSSSFMIIAGSLICPVSAIVLSNAFVDQSIVNGLTIKLLLVAKSSGLPLRAFVKHSCHYFSEMAVASSTGFPFFITLSLLSKVAVIYSVDRTYSRKNISISKFFVQTSKIWRRVVSTYWWACMMIVGCITLFCILLLAICNSFSAMGFPPEINLYAGVMLGLVFLLVFANAIIISNIGVVASVLEDVSGPQALARSSNLIRGKTQVGLVIYLGATTGLVFVEELFDRRVKTLSYGDGSSRIWEGPLLVIMHAFVVLIDMMMSSVLYFSCKSYRMEVSEAEEPPSI